MNYAATIERMARESGRSPLDLLEWFLERAAIREYDGGQDRATAEICAIHDISEALKTDKNYLRSDGGLSCP